MGLGRENHGAEVKVVYKREAAYLAVFSQMRSFDSAVDMFYYDAVSSPEQSCE
jgi:hypothetical protein